MPRPARIVFAGIPHHITQRGNRRADVFFDNADRARYLKLLKEYALIHEVEILAYCLMRNHVHIIAVPRLSDGLQRVLKPLHMRYAQAINRRHGWSGHLWQGRFFSRSLDDEYLWFCVRHVERNCGSGTFVEHLERISQRSLHFRPVGRPLNSEKG